MGNVTVTMLNAFTDGEQGGNPAGVVLDAEHLDRDTRQGIAAHVGVSETAFVSPSEVADFRLEFFTPRRQIAHCGHATVATFVYLAQLGRLPGNETSKETIDGTRRIVIDGPRAFMGQTAPNYLSLGPDTPGVTTADVLAALHLAQEELLPAHLPLVVNTGNSFMLVPLASRASLRVLEPDLPAVERISDALDLIGFYPFTLETESTQHAAATRMFAPRYGIPEEAATGSAAGPLGCYLHDVVELAGDTLRIEQGRLMQPASPSELVVRLEQGNGGLTGVLVGGTAVVTEKRQIPTG